jgi:hypothetical protein
VADKSCFVIAPIGEDDSDTRKRSDKLLKYVISPVVSEKGYEAVRADQIAEPGLITSQVIQHVAEDDLVVADLTERNPNVFYELAIRHALKRPLVQMIARGERIPFDVAGMRTVEIDIRDLDSVERAKEDLARQIDAVEKDPESIDTPIAFALDLQNLRQSDNPEERSLADLVAAVSDLRSGLADIDSRLSNPETVLPPPYFEYLMDLNSRRSKRKGNGSLANQAVDWAYDRIDGALKGNAKEKTEALKEAKLALEDARRDLAG